MAMWQGRGEEETAEQYWYWSCEKINSGQLVEGGPVLDGCTLYRDPEWLLKIRRWPPVVVERLQNFLKLKGQALQVVD